MTYTTAGADHRAKRTTANDDPYVASGFSRTFGAALLVRLTADPTYGGFGSALRVGVLLSLCSVVPRASAAQTPRTWDLFVGYAYLHDSTQDLSLPAGWSASTSRHLSRWLSVVIDAGGHYRTLPLVGGEVSLSLHSVMAGGRASLAVGNFVEFVQIVFGPVRSRGTAFGLTSSDTHFGGQGGIGLDVPLKGKFAARVEFDMRVLQTAHEFRSTVGVVYVR
jgi:hypothetical protein